MTGKDPSLTLTLFDKTNSQHLKICTSRFLETGELPMFQPKKTHPFLGRPPVEVVVIILGFLYPAPTVTHQLPATKQQSPESIALEMSLPWIDGHKFTLPWKGDGVGTPSTSPRGMTPCTFWKGDFCKWVHVVFFDTHIYILYKSNII